MREYFPEALVEVPEEIIKAIGGLPDQKDRHVLGAAILSHANAIVTQNTKDFPQECLQKYGILCQNADDFLVHQYYLGPEQILEKLDYQASNNKQERSALMTKLALPKFGQLVATGKIDC